jgi:hypothetical protein
MRLMAPALAAYLICIGSAFAGGFDTGNDLFGFCNTRAENSIALDTSRA